jgi:hypothetical protein
MCILGKSFFASVQFFGNVQRMIGLGNIPTCLKNGDILKMLSNVQVTPSLP